MENGEPICYLGFMLLDALIAKLKSLRPVLMAEGVEHVTLFGSQARGNATEASDIDIAIDVLPGGRFSILNLVGVEQAVSDATGRPANAFLKRSLDLPFRTEIEREGIAIF